ncbi:MAG TPA: phosphoenolpyruvate carboxykinase [Dehalococcoidia bacterium]|nr:phosphoenolpyruvate carboxykinase [Dehalococcoidia bacterium]
MEKIFGKPFQPRKIIDNPSDESLREWALQHGGVITEFGNLSVVTQVRNRMAKLTEVIMGDPDPEDLELIDNVLDYCKSKEIIQLDRTMCMTPGFRRNCRLYVTAEYARLPLMWGNTLFPPMDGEPDFISLAVPEWPDKKVLVFPEMGLTIVLGSDYKGEQKKAMLRQVMYWAKTQGNLGLHAAGKILRVKRDNQLKDFGFLLFGLSATGKTTLSCHSHWLKSPETVVIRQDDVVILRRDGSAVGTEDSYYIKTEGLEPSSQPLLYAAALSPRAILENVLVNPATGKVDFFDSTITSNGRAMVKRKDIAFTDGQIDIPKVDFILFITRRHDIVPPVVRLSREWAAVAFMLGESVETSAGDPTQAGKALRVVGTNPFIVGSHAEEGNMFLSILQENLDIQCFTLNTGHVGGMDRGQKITVRDSVKIIEMIAKDRITWRRDDFWGYDVPLAIPDVELDRFEPKNYYSDEQIEQLSYDLKMERLNWLAQFPSLKPEILNVLKQ